MKTLRRSSILGTVLFLLVGLPTLAQAGNEPDNARWDLMQWDTGIWAPVPEPSQLLSASAALLTLGAIACTRKRARRRGERTNRNSKSRITWSHRL